MAKEMRRCTRRLIPLPLRFEHSQFVLVVYHDYAKKCFRWAELEPKHVIITVIHVGCKTRLVRYWLQCVNRPTDLAYPTGNAFESDRKIIEIYSMLIFQRLALWIFGFSIYLVFANSP